MHLLLPMQQVKAQWDAGDVQVTAQVAVLVIVTVALVAVEIPVILLAITIVKLRVENINSTSCVADVLLEIKKHICIV